VNFDPPDDISEIAQSTLTKYGIYLERNPEAYTARKNLISI